MLTPLAMLNAEGFDTFNENSSTSKKFFSKGFTRNFILLHWSVMGMIIAFSFLCNLRAMILKPQMERPIDTTKDLNLSGTAPMALTPIYANLLRNAPDWQPWSQNAGETAYTPGNFA